MRSLESVFRFRAYKIDRLELAMPQTVEQLLSGGATARDVKVHWELSLRTPIFFRRRGLYVAGMDTRIVLLPEDAQEEEPDPERFFDDASEFVRLQAGIVGAFEIQDERFEPKIEQYLAKVQAPAILLSFLRAAVTSTFALAGFGSVVLPLINIRQMAEESGEEVQIKVVE